MKRAFTLVEAVIIVAVILIAAAILFPVFARSRATDSYQPNCQSHLKQVGLGFFQYVQDYDEKFPPAHATPTIGWADEILPYVRLYSVFECPQGDNTFATPVPSSPPSYPMPSGVLSDYFYNRRLERVLQNKIVIPSSTLLAGDGPDNAPSWSSQIALPPDATRNSSSPAQRHDRDSHKGANYAFADGHVKWLAPDKITGASPKAGAPTFALR